MRIKRLVVLIVASLLIITTLVYVITQSISNDMSARQMRALERQSLVTIEIDHENSTNRRIIYRMVNNTDDGCRFDAEFTLYTRRGIGWVAVPPIENIVIVGLGWPLRPHSYAELTLNIFDDSFGRLPRGEYRIVRAVYRRVFVNQRVGYVFEDLTVVGRFTIP